MSRPEEDEIARSITADVVTTLVANHRDFLGFVQRRVGDRALAEEILQDAFVRSIDKVDTVRDTAVGWFYRVLRNAIIDHQRRRVAAARRLDAFAHEQDEVAGDDAELQRVVCKCVGELADTLKPEYAAALRRIEIDGVSVKDYAEEAGISSSNAGVRVFRAREALRKQVAKSCGTCADHGCLDCTCDKSMTHGCGESHGHGHAPHEHQLRWTKALGVHQQEPSHGSRATICGQRAQLEIGPGPNDPVPS